MGKVITYFDNDDVLLNLNEAVYPFLGLPMITDFKYRTSGQYTEDQIQKITEAYSDPETFRRAKFAKGADHILEVETVPNSEVRICTRSFNQDIADVKAIRIPEHTHIDPSKIYHQIGLGHEKEIPKDADIFVEDCIENLLRLEPGIVRILINKSHNRRTFDFDFYNRIYRFDTLMDAIVFIKHLISSGLIYDRTWRLADFGNPIAPQTIPKMPGKACREYHTGEQVCSFCWKYKDNAIGRSLADHE